MERFFGNAAAIAAVLPWFSVNTCEATVLGLVGAFAPKISIPSGFTAKANRQQESIGLGRRCLRGAAIREQMDGRTMGVAGFLFANAGKPIKIFLLTWADVLPNCRLIESTTMAITSPEIADGPPENNKGITVVTADSVRLSLDYLMSALQ